MENLQSASKPVLDLLNQIQSQYGLIVLILVAIIGFGAMLFWSLIWKAWRAAMNAKDQQIARLEKERDRYEGLVFARLLTREVAPFKRPGNPESSENVRTSETHPC